MRLQLEKHEKQGPLSLRDLTAREAWGPNAIASSGMVVLATRRGGAEDGASVVASAGDGMSERRADAGTSGGGSGKLGDERLVGDEMPASSVRAARVGSSAEARRHGCQLRCCLLPRAPLR